MINLLVKSFMLEERFYLRFPGMIPQPYSRNKVQQTLFLERKNYIVNFVHVINQQCHASWTILPCHWHEIWCCILKCWHIFRKEKASEHVLKRLIEQCLHQVSGLNQKNNWSIISTCLVYVACWWLYKHKPDALQHLVAAIK